MRNEGTREMKENVRDEECHSISASSSSSSSSEEEEEEEEEKNLILNHKRHRTNYNSMYPYYMDYDSSSYLSDTSFSYLEEFEDSDLESESDSDSNSAEAGASSPEDQLFSITKQRKAIKILSHGWVPNFSDGTPPCSWVKILYDNGDEGRVLVPIFIGQSARSAKLMQVYANQPSVNKDVAFQNQIQWLCSLRATSVSSRKRSNGNVGTKRVCRRSKSSSGSKPTTTSSSSRTIRKSIKHINKSVAIPGSNIELLDYVREIKRSTNIQKECFLDEILDRRHLVETRKVKELGSNPFLEQYGGYKLDLLSMKLRSSTEKQNFQRGGAAYGSSKKDEAVISYFVRYDDDISIQEELEKIGNWSALPSTTKLAARFCLLQSPLVRLNKDGDVQYCVHDSVFEDVEEGGHTGCGFIDSKFLEDILGKKGSRTNCIQVRLFIPRKGIYKGMLMKKPMDPNSPVKVQLPTSMKKVPASKCPVSEYGSICICKAGIDPSDPCVHLGDLYSRDFKKKNLDKGKLNTRIDSKKEGEGMLTRLLKHHGVSVTTMKQYHEVVKEFVARYDSLPIDERDASLPSVPIRHSYLRGVADPTGHVPSDMVFIPGLEKDPSILRDVDTIFITRSPSLMPDDVKVVNLMKTKPEFMPQEDFEFLNSLKFGVVIFGFSKEGTLPIPECISRGDLDGDRYFCCWSKDLLSELKNEESLMYAPIHSNSNSPTGLSEADPIENENWFDDLQSHLKNSKDLHDKQELIGLLYNASLKAAEISDDFLDDKDATAYARAYIDAIDTAKHDTPIRLPKYLWNEFLPKGKSADKYRRLLTDV